VQVGEDLAHRDVPSRRIVNDVLQGEFYGALVGSFGFHHAVALPAWDRVSAAKADTVPICTTGVPGCRRLLVALFPVRVLFWSAKHLFHG
jgi:hypothetical protein